MGEPHIDNGFLKVQIRHGLVGWMGTQRVWEIGIGLLPRFWYWRRDFTGIHLVVWLLDFYVMPTLIQVVPVYAEGDVRSNPTPTEKPCWRCDGSGKVGYLGSRVRDMECSTCHGSGHSGENTPTIGGQGRG